ncbi:MAG: response regulator transcription factor [Chloroflexi bacterium]|nr:response regulator transcription factor [Chloroflexota bacterium]
MEGGAGSNRPIRILIADDHWVVREGLRMYLGRDPAFQVVGEAEDGQQAVRLAAEHKPDVVLMDLLMPVLDGIAAITAIRRELPGVEVVALTSVFEDDQVVSAIRAGAIGYVLKHAHGLELKEAIRSAAEGRVHLSPEAAERLLREVRGPQTSDHLTERETEVLRLVSLGLSNKQIARELQIGEGTVKTHVSSVLNKLGLQSRTQAALHAVRLGLVRPEEVGTA